MGVYFLALRLSVLNILDAVLFLLNVLTPLDCYYTYYFESYFNNDWSSTFILFVLALSSFDLIYSPYYSGVLILCDF